MHNNPKKWLALAAMGMGVFMGLLDVTVVNVALPTMAIDFKTTFTNLQWVLNAYTLVFAVTLLILSKMGDMYGRKKIFLGSLILFVIASAVNGMAQNLLVLDLGRAVQAIGGAGMMSLSMALVGSNFRGAQRGMALGILGSIIGLSSASGPLIGGALVEQFGWPSIFYINVPFGIIAVIMTILYVEETPSYGANQRIDLIGMLLSATGLFSLIYGFIIKEGHSHWSWLDPRISVWIGAGIILLALFIWAELRIKEPMMNVHMLLNPHFFGTAMVAFALGVGIYSFNAFLTALMQNYIGYTAFETGIRQLTISVWSLVLGPLTGFLAAKFSAKRMIQLALMVGAVGFFWLMNIMTINVSFAQLWPGMVMIGITNGIVNPMINTAGMDGIAPQEMGMASGLLNVFRQLGTTVGIVGLGLVQTSRYESALTHQFASLTKIPVAAATGIHKALVNAGAFSGNEIATSARVIKSGFGATLHHIVFDAYTLSMHSVTLVAGIVLLCGAVAATLMRKAQS